MFVLQRLIEVPWSLGTKFAHHFFKEVFDSLTINATRVTVSPVCPARTTRIAYHTRLR